MGYCLFTLMDYHDILYRANRLMDHRHMVYCLFTLMDYRDMVYRANQLMHYRHMVSCLLTLMDYRDMVYRANRLIKHYQLCIALSHSSMASIDYHHIAYRLSSRCLWRKWTILTLFMVLSSHCLCS